MKCIYCNKGIEEGKNMLPVDPAGTPNRRWACTDCVGTDNVPKDVKELWEILDGGSKHNE